MKNRHQPQAATYFAGWDERLCSESSAVVAAARRGESAVRHLLNEPPANGGIAKGETLVATRVAACLTAAGVLRPSVVDEVGEDAPTGGRGSHRAMCSGREAVARFVEDLARSDGSDGEGSDCRALLELARSIKALHVQDLANGLAQLLQQEPFLAQQLVKSVLPPSLAVWHKAVIAALPRAYTPCSQELLWCEFGFRFDEAMRSGSCKMPRFDAEKLERLLPCSPQIHVPSMHRGALWESGQGINVPANQQAINLGVTHLDLSLLLPSGPSALPPSTGPVLRASFVFEMHSPPAMVPLLRYEEGTHTVGEALPTVDVKVLSTVLQPGHRFGDDQAAAERLDNDPPSRSESSASIDSSDSLQQLLAYTRALKRRDEDEYTRKRVHEAMCLASMHCEWINVEQTRLEGTVETHVGEVHSFLSAMGTDFCELFVPHRKYTFWRSSYGSRALLCTCERHVESNESVEAHSMHSTSVRQGIRADSVAQADYDMASSSVDQGLGPHASPPWRIREESPRPQGDVDEFLGGFGSSHYKTIKSVAAEEQQARICEMERKEPDVVITYVARDDARGQVCGVITGHYVAVQRSQVFSFVIDGLYVDQHLRNLGIAGLLYNKLTKRTVDLARGSDAVKRYRFWRFEIPPQGHCHNNPLACRFYLSRHHNLLEAPDRPWHVRYWAGRSAINQEDENLTKGLGYVDYSLRWVNDQIARGVTEFSELTTPVKLHMDALPVDRGSFVGLVDKGVKDDRHAASRRACREQQEAEVEFEIRADPINRRRFLPDDLVEDSPPRNKAKQPPHIEEDPQEVEKEEKEEKEETEKHDVLIATNRATDAGFALAASFPATEPVEEPPDIVNVRCSPISCDVALHEMEPATATMCTNAGLCINTGTSRYLFEQFNPPRAGPLSTLSTDDDLARYAAVLDSDNSPIADQAFSSSASLVVRLSFHRSTMHTKFRALRYDRQVDRVLGGCAPGTQELSCAINIYNTFVHACALALKEELRLQSRLSEERLTAYFAIDENVYNFWLGPRMKDNCEVNRTQWHKSWGSGLFFRPPNLSDLHAHCERLIQAYENKRYSIFYQHIEHSSEYASIDDIRRLKTACRAPSPVMAGLTFSSPRIELQLVDMQKRGDAKVRLRLIFKLAIRFQMFKEELEIVLKRVRSERMRLNVPGWRETRGYLEDHGDGPCVGPWLRSPEVDSHGQRIRYGENDLHYASGGREAPDPPLDGAFTASEELRESGGLGRELIDGEEAVAQVALSIVQGNAFVNAQSMHSTSIHQGLRADSVAQPDYDMASASDLESEDEVPVDSPPALLKVRIAICRMPCPSEMRRRFFDSMYNWDTYLDFNTNFHDMADSLAQIFNNRLARSDQDSDSVQDSDNLLDQIMGPYLPTEDPRYSGYFMSAPTYQDLLAVIEDKCSESQVPHVRLLGADPQGVASFARARYRRLQYALHQAVLEDEAKKLVEKCNSEFKKLDRKIVLPATWNASVEALNSAWKVYNDLRFAPARIEFEIREIGGVEARRVRLRGIFRLLRHIIIMVMLWKARMLERLYAPGGGAALAAQVRFERRAAIMDSLGSS